MDNIKTCIERAYTNNVTVDDKESNPSDGFLDGAFMTIREVNIPLLEKYYGRL
jgi:hypothetical protein